LAEAGGDDASCEEGIWVRAPNSGTQAFLAVNGVSQGV